MSKLKIISIVSVSIASGILLLMLTTQYTTNNIEVTPDSSQYHFLAVNMLQGRGYFDVPIKDGRLYDDWTINQFSLSHDQDKFVDPEYATVSGIPPGYPIFIAAIYSIYGVVPDRIVDVQKALVFGIGILMFLIGWQIWRYVGGLFALIAVFLLGMNQEFSYMVPQLLSETLAAFLLTLCLATALWARVCHLKVPVTLGILFALAVLVRPALVFAGVLYGAILVYDAVRNRSATARNRAISYGSTFALVLAAWLAFSGYLAGGEPPIFNFGALTIKMGLRAETGAKMMEAGISTSEVAARDLISELRGKASAPRAMIEIIMTKMQESIARLPRILWNAILLSFALLSALIVRKSPQDKIRTFISSATPRVFYWRQPWKRPLALCLVPVSLIFFYLVMLNWSAPWVQLWFLVLPVFMQSVRFEIQFNMHGGLSLMEGDYRLILAWIYGFLAIVILTIGLPRYMRPFLPVFYLFASMVLPLVWLWMTLLLKPLLSGRTIPASPV